jgi:hypothetical protein
MFFLDQNGKRIGEPHLGFMMPDDFSAWVSKMADTFKKAPARSKSSKRS